MHVRKLARADIPETASIAADAFMGDDLFTWLHPRSREYPSQYRYYFVRRLRLRIVQPGFYSYVSVSDENDDDWDGKPRITGFAIWEREGDGPEAKKWQRDSVTKKLERTLITAENIYIDTFRLDPSVDQKNLALFASIDSEDIFAKIPNKWHLMTLGVSPLFQRRGIGGLLVKHGLEIAAKENIPVALEASPVGRGLYLKLGFREFGWNKFIDGLEGPAFLWEPEGQKGAWGTALKSMAEDYSSAESA